MRQGVEYIVIGSGLHGGRQKIIRIGFKVAIERLEPLIGGELRGPYHVQRHDIVVIAACLQGLHQGFALGIGLTGQLLEGDLLVWVLLVPLFDDGGYLVRVIFAHGKGDGAARIRAALGGTARSGIGGGRRTAGQCQNCGCRNGGAKQEFLHGIHLSENFRFFKPKIRKPKGG